MACAPPWTHAPRVGFPASDSNGNKRDDGETSFHASMNDGGTDAGRVDEGDYIGEHKGGVDSGAHGSTYDDQVIDDDAGGTDDSGFNDEYSIDGCRDSCCINERGHNDVAADKVECMRTCAGVDS